MVVQVLTAIILSATAVVASAQDNAGLRIVVIEGEAAVNIIQQRSAVAPVVEVRDRNNQPVAGAVVRFAIQNGRATFSGAQTLTVTTNAAGRAVATGLTPTGSGALQIGTSVAFQGQTAAATIAQTNVMTAAQAAQIGAASGASGSGAGSGATAGGAGAGGGGGLSLTTVGIIGGAAAGGALAVNELLLGDVVEYRGPIQLQTVVPVQRTTAGTTVLVCSHTVAIAGSAMIEILDGAEVGDFYLDYTMTQVSTTCSASFSSQPQRLSDAAGGTPQNIQFSKSFNNVQGTVTSTSSTTFTGSLAGTVVTGTVTITWTDTEQISGATLTSTIAPTPIAVTLQQQ